MFHSSKNVKIPSTNIAFFFLFLLKNVIDHFFIFYQVFFLINLIRDTNLYNYEE
jgi:hypothetical protein